MVNTGTTGGSSACVITDRTGSKLAVAPCNPGYAEGYVGCAKKQPEAVVSGEPDNVVQRFVCSGLRLVA